MSVVIKRPLNENDKKVLAAKTKPSAEDLQSAQDQLFMYLLGKVAELEQKEANKN